MYTFQVSIWYKLATSANV